MKGKTSNGFKFEFEDSRLDNMELMDCIAGVEKNPLLFSRLCVLLLGEEQRDKLYDHLRTEDGRVPIEAVSNAIEEIMNAADESKNS